MNRLFVLSFSALAVGFAEAAAPVVFEPFRPGEVMVGGEIGRRMEITAAKLMRTDIEKTFVSHFRDRKAKPAEPGGFAGYGTAMLLSYFIGQKKYPIRSRWKRAAFS